MDHYSRMSRILVFIHFKVNSGWKVKNEEIAYQKTGIFLLFRFLNVLSYFLLLLYGDRSQNPLEKVLSSLKS